MFNWLKRSAKLSLQVDMHSHLLPGLDDGAQTFGESEQLIRYFQSLGYRKLITTPHVMSDTYRNTTTGIRQKLSELRRYLAEKNIGMEIHAAAEYYLDEMLMERLQTNEPLLTLGKNFLLFETNFLSEPLNLKEFIFLASTKGYKPVLAHPERYLYLQQNFEKAEDLLNRGVLFQVNISSITGFYSRPAQVMARQLIDRGWVHWLGSDCHQLQHLKMIEAALKSKYMKKALTLPLLNNSLQ